MSFSNIFSQAYGVAQQQQGTVGKETAAQSLRQEVGNLQSLRDSLQGARNRHLGNVSNAENRLRTGLSNAATMKVAQSDRYSPTSFRGALDSATRRMRARQGIVNRGDAAIRNQSLKDRIKVAQGSAVRRGNLQNVLQQGINIREGVNVGVSNANNRIKAARANMFGTLAGSAASIIKNIDWGSGGVSQSMDQGTAAADSLNQGDGSLPPDYLDFENPPPVVNT